MSYVMTQPEALAAAQFAAHAQPYQAVGAHAAAEMFVHPVGVSSGSYTAIEAAKPAAAG